MIIILPTVIILGNFKFLATDLSFYQSLYSKVGVYQDFGNLKAVSPERSRRMVDNATNNLFGYFRGKNMLDANFYSTQAVLHLKDVKDLLIFTNGLFYFSFIIAIFVTIVMFLANKTKYIFLAVATAGTITAIFILALGLGLLSFFDTFFLKFHQALFTNTLWLFPADDNSIRLFPRQFFVGFANRLALNIFISATAIAVLSFLAIKLKIKTFKIDWKLKIKN